MGLVVRQPESTSPELYIDNITFTESMPTGTEQLDDLPRHISLGENYPNPFNPSTQIPFTLPETQKVSISVYNVMGQKVSDVINNRTYQAGSHIVSFNASSLSSGIYFYQMTAGDFMETKKLNLIK